MINFSLCNHIDCSKHRTTIISSIFMLVGAFLPIIIDSLIKCGLRNEEFYDAFSENLQRGEVFILTFALLAPMLFLTYKIVSNNKHARPRYAGIAYIISMILLVVSLIGFLYYRIGRVVIESSDKYKDLFNPDLGVWTLIIYLISFIVWYYSEYQNGGDTPDFDSIEKQRQVDLNNRFQASKGD